MKQLTKKLIAGIALLTSITTPASANKKEPWTEAELKAIVQTLAGECYDDKEQDKRKVCEVILNRVSSNKFGDSILSVTTAPNQFNGYKNPSRPISKNDYEVAIKALQDWHDNGCKALSAYLYFKAGTNHENVFRTEF